jgi:hypothetical protein
MTAESQISLASQPLLGNNVVYISTATNQHAALQKPTETLFSMQSVLRLYREGQLQKLWFAID